MTRRVIYSAARGSLVEPKRHISRVLASIEDPIAEEKSPTAQRFRKVGKALIDGAATAAMKNKTTDVFWRATHEKAINCKLASAAKFHLGRGDWDSFSARVGELLDECKRFRAERCAEQCSNEAEGTLQSTKQAVLAHIFAESNLKKTLESLQQSAQAAPEAQHRLLQDAVEARRIVEKARGDLMKVMDRLTLAGPHGSNRGGDLEAMREARKEVLAPIPEDMLERAAAIAKASGTDVEEEEETDQAIEVELRPLGASEAELRDVANALREEAFDTTLGSAVANRLARGSALLQELATVTEHSKRALEQQGFKVDVQDAPPPTKKARRVLDASDVADAPPAAGEAEPVSPLKPQLPLLPNTMSKAPQALRSVQGRMDGRSPSGKSPSSKSPIEMTTGRVDRQLVLDDVSRRSPVDYLDAPAQPARGFRSDKLRRVLVTAKMSAKLAVTSGRRLSDVGAPGIRVVDIAANPSEGGAVEVLAGSPDRGEIGAQALPPDDPKLEDQPPQQAHRGDGAAVEGAKQKEEHDGAAAEGAQLEEDATPGSPTMSSGTSTPESMLNEFYGNQARVTLPRRLSCGEPDFSAVMLLAVHQLKEAVAQQWGSIQLASEDLSTCGGEVGGDGRIGVAALHERLAADGYQRGVAEVCAMFHALGVPSTEGTTISVAEFMRLSAPKKWCQQPELARAASLLRALELRRVLLSSLHGPEVLLARLHAALLQVEHAVQEAGESQGVVHSMRRHTRAALAEALNCWSRALSGKGHREDGRRATYFARAIVSAKGLRVFAEVVASLDSTASHKESAMTLLASALSILSGPTAREASGSKAAHMKASKVSRQDAASGEDTPQRLMLPDALKLRLALEFWTPVFDAAQQPGVRGQMHPLLTRELAAWHLLLIQVSIPSTVAGRYAEEDAARISTHLQQLARAATPSKRGDCDVGAVLQALHYFEHHDWCERPAGFPRVGLQKERHPSEAEQARTLIVAFSGRPILQACMATLPKDDPGAQEARLRGEAALASWDEGLRKIQARWPAPTSQRAHTTGHLATIAALSKAVALAQREGFETNWPDLHDLYTQAEPEEAHTEKVATSSHNSEGEESEESSDALGIEHVVLRRLELRSEQMRRKKMDRKIQLAAATPRLSFLRKVLPKRSSDHPDPLPPRLPLGARHMGELLSAPRSCRIHYKTKTPAVNLPPLPLSPQPAGEGLGSGIALTVR